MKSPKSFISGILTIEQLRDESFERGLGIMGARYGINLFEFEFFLQNIYPEQFEEMESNKWFSYAVDGENNRIKMSIMDIVNLSRVEGVRYASKKSGIMTDMIVKYRRKFFALEKELMPEILKEKQPTLLQLPPETDVLVEF